MTLTAKPAVSTPLWPAALWMGGILSACSAPLLSPSQSNPVQFLFPKFVILGWERFLVSYDPGAEICKYVFGSVTVTTFSCFPPKFEIVYHHFGREKGKKKKNVCKSFKKYSKEMKLAIQLSFYKRCFIKPTSWSWSCRSGLAVFCRSHWFLYGHCCDFGHVWTAALGLIGVNFPPFFCFWEKKNWKWDVECIFKTTTLPHVHPIKIR